MATQHLIPQKHNLVSRILFSSHTRPIPDERARNPQDKGLFNRITWSWMDSLMRTGYDRVLVPEDIPLVPTRDSLKKRFTAYKSYLRRHSQGHNAAYMEVWAVIYALRGDLVFSLLMQVLATACVVCTTVVSRKLIQSAEHLEDLHGQADHGYAVGLTIANSSLNIISIVSDLFNIYLSYMLSEYARIILMAAVHDKMLRLSPQQRHDFSAARITTLSSNDCRRAGMPLTNINTLLVFPLFLGATIGILIYNIGVSGLPGVGLLFVALFVSTLMSLVSAALRQRSMPHQDRRLSLTRETLKNMNIIKYYGWEESFLKMIKQARSLETRFIRLLGMSDGFSIAVLISSPPLAGALSFSVHSIISGGIQPSDAFPSLTLFEVFLPMFDRMSVCMSALADSWVAWKRLNQFFRLQEVPVYIEALHTETGDCIAARVRNASFTWLVKDANRENAESSDAESNDADANDDSDAEPGTAKTIPKTVLRNVNVDIRFGSLTLVVGAVGSGKTSLLSCFINTIPKSAGSVAIAQGVRVSSVMSLWSKNATVRDNILFGQEWDAHKYARVIEMCELKSDISIFVDGDLTEVGENGVTLSGGQKARLALARCLYADADLVVLDDVLSAMDAKVGNHIFDELLGLVRNGKTVVLSTNDLKLLPHADSVIYVDGQGSCTQSASSDLALREDVALELSKVSGDNELRAEIQNKNATVPPYVHQSTVQQAELEGQDASESTTFARSAPKNIDHSDARFENKASGTHDPEKNSGVVVETSRQIVDEARATGSVDNIVLVRYFRLNSWWGFGIFALMTLMVMGYACAGSMSNVVLNWWTSDRFHKPIGFNIGMYSLVAALVGVFFCLFTSLLSYSATASSTRLHNAALKGLYHAPMAFFQTNPLGRLMMRFTGDLSNLDTGIPRFARMSFTSLFSLLASVIVIFVYVPWSLVCLIPIFAIALTAMAFYRPTSRDLNRVQMLYDSRSMACLSEHIDGQEVIVAFSQTEESQRILNERLDDSMAAMQCNEASHFWVALRDGLLCEILTLVTIFLAIFQIFDLNASEIGMLLSILPTVRFSISGLIPQLALFENQLNSVERLDEYATSVAAEDNRGLQMGVQGRELGDWRPRQGSVCFESASLRYRADLPDVLHELSFQVHGGRKLGICGRTGAGKTTTISALFRLVELSSGKIVIDGQDIAELPLRSLRKAIGVIPQQPVLFQGTVRTNLDPFGEHDATKLNSALERTGVPLLGRQNMSLETRVEAEGTNFSLGQRQMLALARALVRNAKILVLDEATAAVDQETDEQIQRSIKTEFADCTVICIAHRLETIAEYDEVLVMGPGGVKLEMGPPRHLYAQKGVFYSMCLEAGLHLSTR